MKRLEKLSKGVVDIFAPAAEVKQAHRLHRSIDIVTVDLCKELEDPSEYEQVVGILYNKYPEVAGSDWFLRIAEAREVGDISDPRAIELFGELALESTIAGTYRGIGARAYCGELTSEDKAILELIIDETFATAPDFS